MKNIEFKYDRLLKKHKDQTRLLKNVQMQLEQERAKNNVRNCPKCKSNDVVKTSDIDNRCADCGEHWQS